MACSVAPGLAAIRSSSRESNWLNFQPSTMSAWNVRDFTLGNSQGLLSSELYCWSWRVASMYSAVLPLLISDSLMGSCPSISIVLSM